MEGTMGKFFRAFTRFFSFVLCGGILSTVPGEIHKVQEANPPGVAMIANPSAHYCISQGYTFQTVATGSGEQGLCSFPDGSACDAWEFLQGKCGQEENFCSSQGLETKVLADGNNPYSREYAACVTKEGQQVGKVTELLDFKTNLVSPACDPESSPLQNQPEEPPAPSEPLQESLTQETTFPGSFDWRDYLGGDWTTPVKNQGTCGSCWAFSAVGAVEASLNIFNNDPNLDLDLSEEYLVSDCSWAGTCCGGWHASALDFIEDNGIPDEACLEYVDGNGCSCWGTGVCTNCNYSTNGACSNRTCSDRCPDWENRLATIDTYYYIPPDITQIKQALIDRGPQSVGLGMVGSFDGANIYRCENDQSINHSTVITGYDDDGGYWIVKNSWGSTWNDNGYFFVGYGECGIEQYVYQPVHIPPDYPKADLVVTDLSISPASPALNQLFDISMTVKNQGEGSTMQVFYLYLFLDYDPTGCKELGINQWLIPQLAPGESYTIPKFMYYGIDVPGPHFLVAYADSECTVDEGDNEGNNELRLDFEIQSGLLFSDNFETGDLSRWSSCKTDGGDLSVTSRARLVGNYGLQALIDDNNKIFCTDETPESEKKFQARFYFHPRSIQMANGDTHVIFQGIKGTSTSVTRIEFRKYQGNYQVRAGLLTDGGTWKSGSWKKITNARHYIELSWRASAAPNLNNGRIGLWIDGVSMGNLTGVDNDTHRIDRVHFGPSVGIDAGTRGKYFLDDFVSRSDNQAIGP
jgi:putative hemolysin